MDAIGDKQIAICTYCEYEGKLGHDMVQLTPAYPEYAWCLDHPACNARRDQIRARAISRIMRLRRINPTLAAVFLSPMGNYGSD